MRLRPPALYRTTTTHTCPGLRSAPGSCVPPLAVLPLERGAHLRSPAVQEHALIRVGDAERGAHFDRGPVEEISHREHFALLGRQPVDRAFDGRARFRVERAPLGFRPRLRRLRPRTTTL